MPGGGQLTPKIFLKPIQGDFPVNLDVGSKMDPYCVFKIDGDDERKSSIVHKGGKTPVWPKDENIMFDLRGDEESLEISCYDHDMGEDDYIADRKIPLDLLFKKGSGREWIPMTRQGRDGGRLLLEWRTQGRLEEINETSYDRRMVHVGSMPGQNEEVFNSGNRRHRLKKEMPKPGSRLVIWPKEGRSSI